MRLPAHASARPSAPLVHEGHRLWAAHIPSLKPFDSKAGTLDQFADCAVQMTPAADALPDWCQAILPSAHTSVWRTTMLNKKQTPAGFQNTTHLSKRALHVRDAAQRPRRDDRVDASVVQRNSLGVALDQFDRSQGAPRGFACHR